LGWLWLVVKPVPVLCLVLWVLGAPKSAYRNRLAAGLGLSLAGDVLIEWSFVAGLAAFLLAHIAYVAAFLADTKRPRLLRAAPIAAYGAGMTAFLWPGLGAMRPAVMAYVIAICSMVWRAAARVGQSGAARPGEWAALAGAILFALSDTLIALDRFHSPIAGVQLPIILLYWAGQVGIAMSAATGGLGGPRVPPAQ
jgi:alkenylglycerophosphocholine/alkenylglycerophosphoethanolamine hydrolase